MSHRQTAIMFQVCTNAYPIDQHWLIACFCYVKKKNYIHHHLYFHHQLHIAAFTAPPEQFLITRFVLVRLEEECESSCSASYFLTGFNQPATLTVPEIVIQLSDYCQQRDIQISPGQHVCSAKLLSVSYKSVNALLGRSI